MASSNYLQPKPILKRRIFTYFFLGNSWKIISGSIALAETIDPQDGFKLYTNKLDGYLFSYPDFWEEDTTSGNDAFYRNPKNPVENLFVKISSPSSTKLGVIEDLGSPGDVAKKYLNIYLREFMSTRLGVSRDAEIISAKSRIGKGNKNYYDIEFAIRSFASRQQLAITQAEGFQELEWDRKYSVTLGTANGRLYELRVQTNTSTSELSKELTRIIQDSFECIEATI